ncbi:MAG: hypothetical protein AB1673_10320 [Actinomycetota bacterium]
MRFSLFSPKTTRAEIEREAQQELDSAMSRAQPPSEAERTWVLPMPDAPDFAPRRAPRRPPAGGALSGRGAQPPAEGPAPSRPTAKKTAPSRRRPPAGGTPRSS